MYAATSWIAGCTFNNSMNASTRSTCYCTPHPRDVAIEGGSCYPVAVGLLLCSCTLRGEEL
jgi:hypothetical protein